MGLLMSSATILRTWPSCPGVSASGRLEDTRPPSHQRPPLLAELDGRHSRNHTGHFRGPRRGKHTSCNTSPTLDLRTPLGALTVLSRSTPHRKRIDTPPVRAPLPGMPIRATAASTHHHRTRHTDNPGGATPTLLPTGTTAEPTTPKLRRNRT